MRKEKKICCCNFVLLLLFTFKSQIPSFWLQMLPVSALVSTPQLSTAEFTDCPRVQPQTCPRVLTIWRRARWVSVLSPSVQWVLDRRTLPSPRTQQPSCSYQAPTWGSSPNNVCAARPQCPQSTNKQHQRHQGTCQKCRIWGLTLTYGITICILTRSPSILCTLILEKQLDKLQSNVSHPGCTLKSWI